MSKAYFVEQELRPAGEDGNVDIFAPRSTVTVLVDSSSDAHRLYLKVVDGDDNAKTYIVSEEEILALCKGLQRAFFHMHYRKQPGESHRGAPNPTVSSLPTGNGQRRRSSL